MHSFLGQVVVLEGSNGLYPHSETTPVVLLFDLISLAGRRAGELPKEFGTVEQTFGPIKGRLLNTEY